MKNRKYRKILFFGLMCLLMFLTSCSCSCTGNNLPKTLYAEANTEKNKIEWVNEKLSVDTEGKTNEEILLSKKQVATTLVESYVIYENILNNKNTAYQAEIIQFVDVVEYKALIEKATLTTDTDTSQESKWVVAANYVKNCTNASNADAVNLIKEINSKNSEELSVNDVVCAFILKIDERTSAQEVEPLRFYKGKEFFPHLFNNLLVFPIAWLMVFLSNILGGYYILGLLITTLLVRTVAWPVYAKTNDMSLKMQLMQPELNKIQEKYANKQDERSKQMQQWEMAQLYKKYKVGIGGCLMPFAQFPIFMAIYRAVSKIPYTVAYNYEGSPYKLNWANELNSKFLGIDLLEDRTAGTGQFIGIVILMIIVVGTQFLSQWLSTRRQKKNQQEAQADIPAYRRQSYEQTKNSSQGSMKMMMYMMMLMMGLFVFTSKAGLGVYWCIGNIYSMIQMTINSKTSNKRMEKMKNKF